MKILSLIEATNILNLHGFIENKGRNKDFTISNNMYRKKNMKILDLLEFNIKSIDSKQDKNIGHMYAKMDKFDVDQRTKEWNDPNHRREKYRKGINVLGVGGYGAVLQKERNPNQVTKISIPLDNLEKDAYFQYIQATKDIKNSYFPIITQVKIYKHKNNNYTYRVDMEKLFPSNNLSGQQLNYLYNKMFIRELAPHKEISIDNICNNLFVVAEESQSNNFIKDKNLKHAMQIIISLNKKFNIDIDVDNVMIRNTGKLIELVIIDPLS